MKFEAIKDNKLYFTSNNKLESKNIVHVKYIGDGELFVKDTNIEDVFTYGFKTLSPDVWGHPAGYVWTSRASVMNRTFNLSLIDVYCKFEDNYHYTTCAITLDKLNELLNEANQNVNITINYTEEDTTYIVEAM